MAGAVAVAVAGSAWPRGCAAEIELNLRTDSSGRVCFHPAPLRAGRTWESEPRPSQAGTLSTRPPPLPLPLGFPFRRARLLGSPPSTGLNLGMEPRDIFPRARRRPRLNPEVPRVPPRRGGGGRPVTGESGHFPPPRGLTWRPLSTLLDSRVSRESRESLEVGGRWLPLAEGTSWDRVGVRAFPLTGTPPPPPPQAVGSSSPRGGVRGGTERKGREGPGASGAR